MRGSFERKRNGILWNRERAGLIVEGVGKRLVLFILNLVIRQSELFEHGLGVMFK